MEFSSENDKIDFLVGYVKEHGVPEIDDSVSMAAPEDITMAVNLKPFGSVESKIETFQFTIKELKKAITIVEHDRIFLKALKLKESP